MLKNKKIIIPACILFVCVQAVLGYLIQRGEGSLITTRQYISVVLAALFCFLSVEKSKTYIFTQIALLATVGADYFLVHIPQRDQLNGMICFSIVQIFYFLRLIYEDDNKKRRTVHLILRASLSLVAICITLLVLKESADAVAVISVFYFANLILNTVFAFINFKRSPILALGLICFLLCDAVIGLANIGPYMQLPSDSFIHKLLNPGFDPAWAFYVPSQALLSMSILLQRLKKRV